MEKIIEALVEYYTLDWWGMALSLWAVYLLGNKNKIGFLIFAFANLLWVYLGVAMMNSIGIAVGNFVFFIMNVRGYISWNQENEG